jgi:hypothetical protein
MSLLTRQGAGDKAVRKLVGAELVSYEDKTGGRFTNL